MSDWRDDIDAIDAALIDGFQSGFPVEGRPFRPVGAAIGVDETEAVDRVAALLERGVFRRFGPVLNPPVIGSSMLAALAVPEGRFDAVTATVNRHEHVNHNYRRSHEYNMWFVVTAATVDRRDAVVDAIEAETGLTALRLPMQTSFYIDLEFPVVNADRLAGESEGRAASASDPVEPTPIAETPIANLDPFEARLLVAVQSGFPVSSTPYADIAAELGVGTEAVIAGIAELLEAGCIKRIGCVVDHRRTGFDANCMVVWDIPDDKLADRGSDVGGLPYVTLCYHRPRRPVQDWPYNLFTMVHGRDRERVDATIDELADGPLPFAHERLYSTATLKQTGARYEELVPAERANVGD